MSKKTSAPLTGAPKKRYVIVLSTVLAFLLLCGGAATALYLSFQEDDPVLRCGDAVITEPMYAYLMSSYRYRFAIKYKGQELHKNDGDQSVWQAPVPEDMGGTGQSWQKQFDREFSLYLADLLGAASLYKSAFTAEESQALDEEIEALCLRIGQGDEDEADKVLAQYGCSLNDVRRVMALEKKAQLYFEKTYGESGELTDVSLLEKRYQEDFVCVKLIFVRTKGKQVDVDDEGNPVYESMSKEQKDKAAQTISLLQAYYEQGLEKETFLELRQEYNETQSIDYYLAEYSLFDDKVIQAAHNMEVGEYAMVAGEFGTFLLLREITPVGGYATTGDSAQFFQNDLFVGNYEQGKTFIYNVAQELCGQRVRARADQHLTQDHSVTDKYLVWDVKIDYTIY